MPTIEQRLNALEVAVAALTAATPAPAAPSPPPRPAPQDEGASVRVIAPRGIVMPSEAELRELFRIVLSAWPVLRCEPSRFENDDAPFERFENAFRALGAMGRKDALDGSKSMGWWIEEARNILALMSASRDIDQASLVAAIVAHGDIAYQALDRYPHDLAFGLSPHVNAGRAAQGAWRQVLEDCRAPQPARAVPVLPPAADLIKSW